MLHGLLDNAYLEILKHGFSLLVLVLPLPMLIAIKRSINFSLCIYWINCYYVYQKSSYCIYSYEYDGNFNSVDLPSNGRDDSLPSFPILF